MRVAGAGKTCGWKALDHRDVGFFPGELAIVAGRTGHGKTTVILNLLLHWLENYPNDRFILYSYEIPAESVLIKLVSSLTRKIGANGWTYSDIRRWIQTGSISGQSMSVRDIATLSQHIITDFPQFYPLFSEIEFTYNNIKQGNRNPLLYKNMGVDGLKTGHTDEAGYGLAASAIRNGRRVILVVHGWGKL